MKRNRIRMMAATGCIVLATACQQAPGTLPHAEYATMKVATADKELTEHYSASIRGQQDIDIYPQVSGTIQRLCIQEGEKVRRGQVLFVIDQVPYKAALATATANVKAAKAALRTAELNYNSSKELRAQNVISEVNLQTVENAYYSAQAQVAQAEAQELNARNNLSYTEVKAPCDGVAGALPYRVGALVGPSLPQPLTTVSDNSTMFVYFSMTENQLLAYTREHGSMEEAVKSLPEVELQLNDQTLYGTKGRIESISGVIDRQTGTVTARAAFDNAGRLLHSGASGTLLVPSVYKNCIVIPQEATVRMQDKTLVYKVVDGKAVSTLIEVASLNDGREYVVLSGLQPGEEIVAKGAGLVREGAQVK
ncbi:MAG: efflux RND transporter periplasmic adaptor subunit [Phocaeicola plebeius]|nr:efflux RND transporter periplasmic adaptor subunit [Phocaeicola plebeius]